MDTTLRNNAVLLSVVISSALFSACSVTPNGSALSFGSPTAGAPASSSTTASVSHLPTDKIDRVTLLSRQPLVYVSKAEKPATTTHKNDSPTIGLIGRTDRSDGIGPTQTQDTITPGTGPSEAGLDGKSAYAAMPSNPQTSAAVSQHAAVFKDVLTPVAATAYGSSAVVIKSVNGGFGILLLKKGVAQNTAACDAFFNALPSRKLSEIEKAAETSEGLFRPTYWLDRRNEKDLDYRQGYQLASNSPSFLAYLHTDPTDFSRQSAPSENGCIGKTRHYNYAVSHALLERLRLLDRRGPFLAAWKDDGGRAMVLDMSQFDGKLDFDEAMESWMQMIVRRPDLWRTGVHTASLKQRLRKLLNKGGKSILSLLEPTALNAQPFAN